MNRIGWKNSNQYRKKPPLRIKFMVSIGANPITSVGDEKQFPSGSKWLSIKRGKSYLRSKKIMLLLLQERTRQGQLPGQPL